jgi:hypothetical protein
MADGSAARRAMVFQTQARLAREGLLAPSPKTVRLTWQAHYPGQRANAPASHFRTSHNLRQAHAGLFFSVRIFGGTQPTSRASPAS